MRQYIISEERLKDFIRTSKLYGFACESVLYSPSEKRTRGYRGRFEKFYRNKRT